MTILQVYASRELRNQLEYFLYATEAARRSLAELKLLTDGPDGDRASLHRCKASLATLLRTLERSSDKMLALSAMKRSMLSTNSTEQIYDACDAIHRKIDAFIQVKALYEHLGTYPTDFFLVASALFEAVEEPSLAVIVHSED